MIDLRSDTLTKPCADMRQAMANAEVNDDVIDVDPTVAALEERIADILGMETAVFMPSGTMTNQAALRVHCRPGDEFICESGCHIYNYEQGAFAQLSGLVAKTVTAPGRNLRLEHVRNLINPDNEHAVYTRLLCLENTHNKGGGIILPLEDVQSVCGWARENGLATHLDGARFFNCVVASGIEAKTWAENFDTVSICFSKGLGAPVGSCLAGDSSMRKSMIRHRKVLGGGMRQSGIIAAGALYALDNNIDRLADDHRNAKRFAEVVSQHPKLSIDIDSVHTNIAIFHVDPSIGTAAEMVERCGAAGVGMYPFSHDTVRAVTHMHIDEADAVKAAERICEVAG
ncbi:threonine aldolase family protein [Mariniblastus fucicola]|uniref:L-allo-threonine aldolase n=1 Tax=Mariniblastus fucicola TaxID=980251 RepID=A0A5B9PA30_9BACT|nr:GntG family PLP-dependent aldolase [Mariniblastus fucicola]QEG23218.1 L-allo-threonine aldolase [Mariniblastus fucicola]